MSSTNTSRIRVLKDESSSKLTYLVSKYLVNYEGKCRSGVSRYTGLLLTEVRKLSRKRFASLAELKAMGHPYSRNYPNNTKRGGKETYTFKSGKRKVRKSSSALRNTPWLVNNQTGDFYSKWRMNSTRVYQDGDGYTVVNDSEHAFVFTGKKTKRGKMIPRPIIQKAIANVRASHGTLKEFCVDHMRTREEKIAAQMRIYKPVAFDDGRKFFSGSEWADRLFGGN